MKTQLLISHVGSLPFTEVADALAYTFQFDIPVLFTLPQYDSKQFMLDDFVAQLKIGSVINGKICLVSNFRDKSSHFSPPFAKEFFTFLEQGKRRRFKYQLLGPVSFYYSLAGGISFVDCLEFLLPKYIVLLNQLSEFGELYFALDEPLLTKMSPSELELYTHFVQQLKINTQAKLILHCCSELNRFNIDSFDFDYFNLDISLADYLTKTNMPGFPVDYDLKMACTLIRKIMMTKKSIILTPSCGLALTDENHTCQIIHNLIYIRDYCLQ